MLQAREMADMVDRSKIPLGVDVNCEFLEILLRYLRTNWCEKGDNDK